MDNSGLSKTDIQKIREVLARFPEIDETILYGSRAKGNYKPASDIDLSLKGKNLDLNFLLNLEIALDDLLLPYKFDISIFEKISNPEFVDHINRVGCVFYQKS